MWRQGKPPLHPMVRAENSNSYDPIVVEDGLEDARDDVIDLTLVESQESSSGTNQTANAAKPYPVVHDVEQIRAMTEFHSAISEDELIEVDSTTSSVAVHYTNLPMSKSPYMLNQSHAGRDERNNLRLERQPTDPPIFVEEFDDVEGARMMDKRPDPNTKNGHPDDRNTFQPEAEEGEDDVRIIASYLHSPRSLRDDPASSLSTSEDPIGLVYSGTDSLPSTTHHDQPAILEADAEPLEAKESIMQHHQNYYSVQNESLQSKTGVHHLPVVREEEQQETATEHDYGENNFITNSDYDASPKAPSAMAEQESQHDGHHSPHPDDRVVDSNPQMATEIRGLDRYGNMYRRAVAHRKQQLDKTAAETLTATHKDVKPHTSSAEPGVLSYLPSVSTTSETGMRPSLDVGEQSRENSPRTVWTRPPKITSNDLAALAVSRRDDDTDTEQSRNRGDESTTLWQKPLSRNAMSSEDNGDDETDYELRSFRNDLRFPMNQGTKASTSAVVSTKDNGDDETDYELRSFRNDDRIAASENGLNNSKRLPQKSSTNSSGATESELPETKQVAERRLKVLEKARAVLSSPKADEIKERNRKRREAAEARKAEVNSDLEYEDGQEEKTGQDEKKATEEFEPKGAYQNNDGTAQPCDPQGDSIDELVEKQIELEVDPAFEDPPESVPEGNDRKTINDDFYSKLSQSLFEDDLAQSRRGAEHNQVGTSNKLNTEESKNELVLASEQGHSDSAQDSSFPFDLASNSTEQESRDVSLPVDNLGKLQPLKGVSTQQDANVPVPLQALDIFSPEDELHPSDTTKVSPEYSSMTNGSPRPQREEIIEIHGASMSREQLADKRSFTLPRTSRRVDAVLNLSESNDGRLTGKEITTKYKNLDGNGKKSERATAFDRLRATLMELDVAENSSSSSEDNRKVTQEKSVATRRIAKPVLPIDPILSDYSQDLVYSSSNHESDYANPSQFAQPGGIKIEDEPSFQAFARLDAATRNAMAMAAETTPRHSGILKNAKEEPHVRFGLSDMQNSAGPMYGTSPSEVHATVHEPTDGESKTKDASRFTPKHLNEVQTTSRDGVSPDTASKPETSEKVSLEEPSRRRNRGHGRSSPDRLMEEDGNTLDDTESKISLISYLGSEDSDLETNFESSTVPMIVKMLDQGCAWLEGHNCGFESPSLLRESKGKAGASVSGKHGLLPHSANFSNKNLRKKAPLVSKYDRKKAADDRGNGPHNTKNDDDRLSEAEQDRAQTSETSKEENRKTEEISKIEEIRAATSNDHRDPYVVENVLDEMEDLDVENGESDFRKSRSFDRQRGTEKELLETKRALGQSKSENEPGPEIMSSEGPEQLAPPVVAKSGSVEEILEDKKYAAYYESNDTEKHGGDSDEPDATPGLPPKSDTNANHSPKSGQKSLPSESFSFANPVVESVGEEDFPETYENNDSTRNTHPDIIAVPSDAATRVDFSQPRESVAVSTNWSDHDPPLSFEGSSKNPMDLTLSIDEGIDPPEDHGSARSHRVSVDPQEVISSPSTTAEVRPSLDPSASFEKLKSGSPKPEAPSREGATEGRKRYNRKAGGPESSPRQRRSKSPQHRIPKKSLQSHSKGEESEGPSLDPEMFMNLTDEERIAALELAERLKRRAEKLKRRRRKRDKRMKDMGTQGGGTFDSREQTVVSEDQ
uniref:Uncharacterized protein n=1 Tax=Entomoneis paludosa TaxID=265537 RepID=A0A7S3DY66_9STRA|mmetsp:Transcript_7737/g.16140  ORF Transcript_7737/g.16140 Transcript_7737/m.16140 type:complete len:1668 (+) Transcript_7737:124-5127(+)